MTSLEPWKGQRIGNLRERVTIRAYVQTGTTPLNEPIFEWDEVATVAARCEPIKGDELLAAGQVSGYHDMTFHIRHRDDLQSSWEIRWRGRDYNITGWRNIDERRRFLAIEAKAAT